jgi:phosphoinositide-3-kinase regulatory subunit 4
MGNSVAYSHPRYHDVHTLLLEIPNLTPQGDLIASNKLFRSIRCLEQHGVVLAKLYVKRELGPDTDLSNFRRKLDDIHNKGRPYLIPALYLEVQRTAFVIRQFYESTLHQRFLRPPFLDSIEKLWFAYQLLNCLSHIHAANVCHGDIKSENCLVTSWDWLCLADPASFKPTYMQEADLTVYKCFFVGSKRDVCNVAPERFNSEAEKDGVIEKSMDVFSLGCVLAELFRDGQALFSHAELLSYRRGQFSPQLDETINSDIRELILHMIQLDPAKRSSAEEYKQQWCNKVFPYMFHKLEELYVNLVKDLALRSPESKILYLSSELSSLISDYPDQHKYLVILSSLIGTSLRACKSNSSKLRAVKCLELIGELVSDEHRLHRVLPWLLYILTDKDERSNIKVNALDAIVNLLKRTQSLTKHDSSFFEKSVWPALNVVRYNDNPWVQCAFAKHLPELAQLARQFLELERNVCPKEGSFDSQLREVNMKFINLMKALLYDKKESIVQEVLLYNVGKFAKLLDRKLARNELFGMIIPCLKRYRVSLLRQIPELIEIVGQDAFTLYLLPCIEDSLNDFNELHAYETIRAVRLTRVNNSKVLLNFLDQCLVFLVHPNNLLRNEVLLLIYRIIESISLADNYCFLRPKLASYLKLQPNNIFNITPEILQAHLTTPIRRSVYESLLSDSSLPQLKNHEPDLITLIKSYLSKLNKEVMRESQLFSSTRKQLTTFQREEEDGMYKYKPSIQWDDFSPSGRLLFCIYEHSAAVTSLACCEGKLLSGSNDCSIKIWNISDLEK